MIGIYGIKNVVTGKMYIGQSKCIENRFKDHFYDLRGGNHHSPYLQNAFNKYGKDVFIQGVIEECDSSLLNERENYWINYYDTYNNGYNATNVNKNTGGRTYSDEDKLKLSESMKDYHQKVPEHIRKFKGNLLRSHRTNFNNTNKKKLRLYNTNLELIHELNSKDCASLLGVTLERLNKSMYKIRTTKGLTYKGYIIIKDSEDLQEFLDTYINNYNNYRVGYNPISDNS